MTAPGQRSRARRAALADPIPPMLATTGAYPAVEDEYAFEPKWDGIRAVVTLDQGRLRIRSRNLNDITKQYPELVGLATEYEDRRIVLDGEIVAPDEDGRPSFQRLQNRLGVVQRGLAQKRSDEIPVVFIAFDLLYLDGEDLTRLPYEERRAALEALALHGPAWRLSPASVGEGRHLLEMPQFEGVVAKKLGSTYEPGARSRAWIKIKRVRRQELVIGGWSAGQGARSGRIGALLVGYYAEGRFVYAGKVGTGFDNRTLDALQRMMTRDIRQTSPFDTPVDDARNATFITPRYVAEFEFTEWTGDGRLRHPSYKGLREDKDPRQVVREET